MNKIKSAFLLIIINTLVFLLFGEALSVGYYYYTTGNLFYTRNVQKVAEVEHNVIASDKELTGSRLHPLFGFMSVTPGKKFESGRLVVNEYGFASRYGQYPVKKNNENDYIIGIFGGSVAAQLFAHGQQTMIDTLKQYNEFKHKNIIILSFAQGGYKQPQQLLLLSYFLSIGQEFDLVINFDGFNEVVLSEKNHRRNVLQYLPSASHMLQLTDSINSSTLTQEKIILMSELIEMKQEINQVNALINSAKIAIHGLALDFYHAILQDKYASKRLYHTSILKNKANHLIVLNKSQSLKENVFQNAARHWAKSSILMDEICKSMKISYVHFLQPNQYLSNRQFTDEERSIAIQENHIYRQGVINGYPELLEMEEKLLSKGVNFYNAMTVLDEEKEIVYADACCHFNKRGIELLSAYVIRSALGQRDDDFEEGS